MFLKKSSNKRLISKEVSMSDEKMEAMKRAWDKVIIACAEEGLNTEEKLHLLKSMEAFLSDVLQANEK